MNDAQELVNLLDDAISLLKTAVVDDIDNIRGVADVKLDLNRTYAERQDALKKIMRNLSEYVHDLEVTANSTRHEEFVVEFNALQNDKKALMEEIKRLEEEAEKMKLRMTSYKQEMAEVERKQVEADRIHSIDVPKIQRMLSLYCNISGIKWDYESPLVKGVVYGQKDSAPFEFNPKEVSKIELANNLWELIDQSC